MRPRIVLLVAASLAVALLTVLVIDGQFGARPGDRPVARAATLVRLVDAFPGVTFDQPTAAVQPPDGTARMFVAEQGGKIWIVDHPAPAPPAVASKRLFLDLSARVSRAGNEEGLLGLAFHPGYATNGRFFVGYTSKYASSANRKDVVAEWHADPQDADRADPSSELPLLQVADPYGNHNGGWVGFGPDGMLYAGLGDGGSAGDPENRAQDLGSLLGKILRIDVNPGGGTYGTPPDNPFVARAGARPEIYAYGLRNPWRCSFDRATGDLWAGDVGQDAWEEVDRIVPGGNYGWRRREGRHDYRPSGTAPADPLIEPLAEYSHALGASITGGFVYRGAGVPALVGSYVFGDFESGRLWALTDPYGTPRVEDLLSTQENIASFAEDRAGELYVVSFGGSILAIRDGAPAAGPTLPATLSETNVFADLPRARPVADALRYDAISPLWSDGAVKSRFLVLPPGEAIAWRDDDALDVPVGTYAVKTFARRGTRLESRVIRRTAAGFDAATYRWRADRSDADRVDARTDVVAGGGAWTFPSPQDCRGCHTTAAGFLLGVTGRQLPAGTVARWRRSVRLTGAPPPRTVPRNVPRSASGAIGARVRSYLDANCSFCHRPDDPTNASLDLRATTPLTDTGALDAAPQHGDLGIADARIVAAGDPSRSTLLARMRTLGEGRMPALGTSVEDRKAVRLIERWIRRLR